MTRKRTSSASEMIYDALCTLLIEKQKTISTMESCTAGMVSARLANISGASNVFKYSLVTYCDEAKNKLVGVKQTTLDKYTAVSSQTAFEMVQSLDAPLKSDACVGVTGYADGEDGGHVFIACNVCGDTVVKEFHFNGNSNAVRESAATQALILLRDCLLKYTGSKS